MPDRDAGPRIFVPPPLVFVLGWLIAWGLSKRLTFEIDGAGASWLQQGIGAVFVAGGLALGGWGMATFARARTPVVPVRPARNLVTDGPYRFTRNPMYLGLTGTYVGLAALTNQAWPIVFLPAVLLILSGLVIGREEDHLRARFGDAYDAYRRRVRRWL